MQESMVGRQCNAAIPGVTRRVSAAAAVGVAVWSAAQIGALTVAPAAAQAAIPATTLTAAPATTLVAVPVATTAPVAAGSTTPVAALRPTTVLTVSGSTNVVSVPMSTELQGVMCKSPNVCQVVEYLSGGVGDQVYTSGFNALDKSIATTPGPKAVMAYSQGAVVATRWLQQRASASDTPPASDMYFVIFGNAQRAFNGSYVVQKTGTATPNDTKYRVIDVSRQYDGLSDYPTSFNLLAIMNAQAGFSSIHSDYTNVNVNDPNNLVKTVGTTTYVLVPTENLPLLDPLRRIGLTDLANMLNKQLKPMVDSAYDRSGYERLGDRTLLPLEAGPFATSGNPDASGASVASSTPAGARAASTTSANEVAAVAETAAGPQAVSAVESSAPQQRISAQREQGAVQPERTAVAAEPQSTGTDTTANDDTAAPAKEPSPTSRGSSADANTSTSGSSSSEATRAASDSDSSTASDSSTGTGRSGASTGEKEKSNSARESSSDGADTGH